MRVIRCPHCNEPLPGFANYCTTCGKTLLPSPTSTTARLAGRSDVPGSGSPVQPVQLGRPRSLKVPRFFALNNISDETIQFGEHGAPDGDADKTVKFVPKPSTVAHAYAQSSTIPLAQSAQLVDDEEEEYWERHHSGSWHKIVPPRSSGRLSITLKPAPVPPVQHTPLPPLVPMTPSSRTQIPHPVPQRSQESPVVFLISLLLLGAIITGGLLGIVVTLGHGVLAQKPPSTEIVLQVTPTSVALGAMITLRGSNFSPSGRVGLTRDTNIPIFDTADNAIIQADVHGAFTDTVIVGAQWLAGTHILRAEDARLHKIASFSILITGHSPSLRPAHLLLSANTLNLGSGDQATNSTKTISLINAGGGQISWQTTTTQPWLLLSPKSGTFSSGQDAQVTIAVDRTNLQPGTYTAQVIFTSNAGQMPLPVSMQTTPLEVGHEPVMQLTPAVLAFTGVDGGSNPPAQVVTVSNPGLLPFSWSAQVSAGNNWLSVSPSASTVAKGSSQAIVLSVNTDAQLPGTYSAFVTFTGQGAAAVKHSPQSIYVSLTIVPQCGLLVSPGTLSFTGVYLQPSPAAKIISLNVTQGCAARLRWSAATTNNTSGHIDRESQISGVPWLSIATTVGTTPAYPSVSVTTAGLQPGTYTAAILFSSSAGTQTLPVTLMIGPPTGPILATTPATMTFISVIGQPNPPAQAMTITNTGGGTLIWQVTTSTNVGGAWLTVSSTRGTLGTQQSATINVMVSMLPGLTPDLYTYTGMVTISGVDSNGHTVIGSPQVIPVNLTVSPPCTITGTPAALAFTGVVGQPNPATQTVTIAANGTCVHKLNWTASVGGVSWLSVTPASGSIRPSSHATIAISVTLTGLKAGSYTGQVTIAATNNITHLAVGTSQAIAVNLTVQPACTLQPASVAGEGFSSEVGSNPNPATQSFTIGITGACTGSITITPTVTQRWITITPPNATISSGNATFTVAINSASLAVGSYSDTVSLAAVNNGGFTINGSPQTVGISLNVVAPPTLTVNPGASGMTISIATGTISQPISINNTGGEPLNWTAALGAGTPSFISLSATSGTNLAGGTSAAVNVVANVTGIPGGSTFNTSVTVNAIDLITGNSVAGSPTVIPITINVAPSSMSLSTTTLSYNTAVGVNPSSQSLVLTNMGGDGLTWAAGTPSQSWLTLGLNSGSDNAGGTSTIPFNVDITGLTSGSYTATVVITPSVGSAQTVTVNLTVN